MTFPDDFPEHSRAVVIGAKIRAAGFLSAEIQQLKQRISPEDQSRRYVLQIFKAFTHAACELGRVDRIAWNVARIELEAAGFLLMLAVRAQSDCDELGLAIPSMVAQEFRGLLRRFMPPPETYIKPDVLRALKASDEWRAYQDELLEVAELQGRPNLSVQREQRRGYRSEVFAWMKRTGIETVPNAAKRLGVSDSTLKSIMSEKGERRYGQDTLDKVLKKIAASETSEGE